MDGKLDRKGPLPRGAATSPVQADCSADEVKQSIAQALARNPSRNDLRTTLIEVLFLEADAAGFYLAVTEFAEHLKPSDALHWARVSQLAARLTPQHPICLENFAGCLDHRNGAAAAPAPVAVQPVCPIRQAEDDHESYLLERATAQLKKAHQMLCRGPSFVSALSDLLQFELGRPTALEHLRLLSSNVGGAQIYVKREDLRCLHNDHQIHVYGQMLLAQTMGKREAVAVAVDTHHGAAVASAAKALKMETSIYIPGRYLDGLPNPNIDTMRRCRARLIAVEGQGEMLKECQRLATRRWLQSWNDSSFISSLLSGPATLLPMVQDFQAIVGREVHQHWVQRHGHLPQALVCSAEADYEGYGFVTPFIEHAEIAVHCVKPGSPAAAPVQNAGGNPSRQLSTLIASGRVVFPLISNAAANDAASLCSRLEGHYPNRRNSEVLAQSMSIARRMGSDQAVVAMFA